VRLLYKHSRYILLTNLLILLLGGILFYGLFTYIIDRNIRSTLGERRDFAREKLAQSDSLYIYQNFSYHIFSIQRLPKAYPFTVSEQISDTAIFDPVRKKASLYRQLTFTDNLRGQPFRVTVRRPLIDDFEILRGIVASLLLLAVVLGVTLFFSNRIVSKKLWQPFYITLARLKDYQLDERIEPDFPQTNVREFNELIDTLGRLIERTRRDYRNLKEYTENTTHEIQTPLAIIQSKLELLQENDLSIEQLQLVNTANQAVSRLSRLKEALLLLVRIKNNQYTDAQNVELAKLVTSRLNYFEELIEMKQVRLSKQLDEQAILQINPLLAEILIDNLVSNAIKYNVPGGEIRVTLTNDRLSIFNTGQAPTKPTSAFFDRFVKADSASRSLGLGLAIVKAICETNRLSVEYNYSDGYHQISVTFSSEVVTSQYS
jgi:signal transduction histidine kinase